MNLSMAMQLQNNKMYILHRLFSNRTSEFEYTKDEFLDFFRDNGKKHWQQNILFPKDDRKIFDNRLRSTTS